MEDIGPTRLNLNFTRVFRVKDQVQSLEIIRKKVSEIVTTKEFISGKTKDGFVQIPIKRTSESETIKEVLKKTIMLRYLKERKTNTTRLFRPAEGSRRGKLTKGFPTYFDAVDLVWYHPHIILLRGPQSFVPEAFQKMAPTLGLSKELPITGLSPFFLLWILLEWMDNRQNLSTNLAIERPRSLRAIGIPDYSGSEIAIQEADRLLKSLPANTALLDGLGLSALKGTFLVDGEFRLSARLFSGGGLWVFVSDYLRSNTETDTRLAASALLAHRLFSVFTKWDRLPQNKKIPSEAKYKEITERASELLDERIQKGERIRRAARRRSRRGSET